MIVSRVRVYAISDQDDAGPFGHETVRRRPAEAARSAGDDEHPVLQL